MEKKTAHMSAAEIREQRLKVLYRILPIVSLLLLVALWLLASSGVNSNFPTPQAVWDRTVRLFTNPVKKLTLVGHALVSLRRIGLALVFDWTAGIAFGVLLGWCLLWPSIQRLPCRPSASLDSSDHTVVWCW